ncbi:MAG: prolyl oligopeptidase family serine peptidase [Armatimonadetes bacterium]|nr:prolyl oligopeptidase family serine peptidase [Armatimonadota bacterium]
MKLLFSLSLFTLASVGFAGPKMTLESHPHYQDYLNAQRTSAQILRATRPDFRWDADSEGFTYYKAGKTIHHLVKSGQETEMRAPSGPGTRTNTSAEKQPNGNLTIRLDGKDLFLVQENGERVQVTNDGSDANLIRNGVVPWVYREELGLPRGFGWSPSGKQFWYLKFDSSPVKPFYLLDDQLSISNDLATLDYPKAGGANPKASLFVYDLATERSIPLLTVPNSDENIEYVYDLKWLPGGQLVYQLADRLQQVRTVQVFFRETGKRVTALKEICPNGYQSSFWRIHASRALQDVKDKLILASESTGFFNWVEIDLITMKQRQLTSLKSEVDLDGILWLDDQKMVFESYGGTIPLAKQFWVHDLKSNKSKLLTDTAKHHTFVISPNGQRVIGLASLPNTAPTATLSEISTNGLKTMREIDIRLPAETATQFRSPEMLTFKAADGKTDLHAVLKFPSYAKPGDRFPVIFDVYSGPEMGDYRPGFMPIDPMTELGFIVAQAEVRGGLGRGRDFRNANYLKLGVVEIDDLAACAEALKLRADIEPTKIGIYGTSYGGYATLMALVRHPQTFTVGVSSSPVTDWANYDTIYTERYMGLPAANSAGYKASSANTYAKDLTGGLLLYFGTADDNVHPNNSLQFIEAMNRAKRDYELRVGPDRGHTFVGEKQMLEFFINRFQAD